MSEDLFTLGRRTGIGVFLAMALAACGDDGATTYVGELYASASPDSTRILFVQREGPERVRGH